MLPPDHPGIDPATRSFQALRIRVNDELGEIERALEQATRGTSPAVSLVVVSFHSLEDRIVKRFMADAAGVVRLGLDAMDRRYLRRIAEHHAGGPVGVETLAAALAEARDTLEDVVEPFLIQEGLVLRTSRGRMLGEPGWRHLDLPVPARQPDQLDLLRE